MNNFTASNDVGIRLTKTGEFDGDLDFKNGQKWLGMCGGKVVQALREFFQAEADDRLSRWRDPERPHLTAYPTAGYETDEITILDEQNAECYTITREASEKGRGGWWLPTARAYFDAHPEPKPWTRAKEGESWYLTITSLGPGTSLRWVAQGSPTRFWSGALNISADSNEISDDRHVNAGMS